MKEQDLQEHGISIEPFLHRNGSPYGQYWGYVVVQQNGFENPIIHGRQSKGDRMPLDPFLRRKRAMAHALTLVEHAQDEEDDSFGDDLHEDPWIDIGGEG